MQSRFLSFSTKVLEPLSSVDNPFNPESIDIFLSMIDSFIIFTKGGLVLWEFEETKIEGQPVFHLIQEVLLQERLGQSSFTCGNHILKWTFANEFNLVFVACGLKIGKVTGLMETLLPTVRDAFLQFKKVPAFISAPESIDYKSFDARFQSILSAAQSTPITKKSQPPQPKNNIQLKITDPEDEPTVSSPQSPQTDISIDDIDNDITTAASSQGGEETGEDDDAVQRLLLFKERRQQRIQQRKQQTEQKKKTGKQATKWADSKVSSEEAAALDFSEQHNIESGTVSQRDIANTLAQHGTAPVAGEQYWNDDVEDESGRAGEEEQPSSSSGMWGYFQNLIGQKDLTKEDLAGVSEQFRSLLIGKNVSQEIATKLVDSVVESLVGRRIGTFNTLYSTVRQSLEASLTRLLTPNKPVDILTGVANAKQQHRPYSIVFCGVNGVGKSTSLSKVAAFFLSQNLRVGVAACDTFRSGAIEQLRTHCAALNIPLYDRGYGRDEASVAADGILNAKKDNLDVILIDTAGRMQGNDPLMKGLARLMSVNNPDLILFVGEALVGNDGTDQLMNFNRALRENSTQPHPRLIDGIVLTKFDTIDDKVGTAINMVYGTGQPIVFVGVGQTYRDLKRPSPKTFTQALLG